MGYTYYRYQAFIPSSNPLTFDSLVQLFHESLIAGRTLDIVPDTIVLKHNEWSMRIYWQDQPHVLEESQEMAGNPKLAFDFAALLTTCDRRITTAGDDDPEMKYFNDCVFVLETLNLLEGVIRLDLSGEFVDQFGDL